MTGEGGGGDEASTVLVLGMQMNVAKMKQIKEEGMLTNPLHSVSIFHENNVLVRQSLGTGTLSPGFTTMNYKCPVSILYKSHVARFQ